MARLVECAGCGGLKRAQSERCPHCRLPAVSKTSAPKKALTLLGLGALAACTSSTNLMPIDGSMPDASMDGSGMYTQTDAYGVVPFQDAGDAGDAGKMYTQTDAYGLPPFLEDAGVNDAGDGGTDTD
jgi:hypothetical protein